MVAVSIIIPVYNVEKYIRKALDSVVNQSLKDIEIICINDCTPDKSFEIVKEYASKDNRFKLIEQPTNQGQGMARNLGIEIAKGDYIMFLDPDDWYEEDACELCFNQIKENNNDFVVFDFYEVNEKNISKKCRSTILSPYKNVLDDKNINLGKLKTNFIKACYTVIAIYKTEFLKKNNIKYDKSLRLAEDVIFYFLAIVNASTISVLNKPIYNYLKHDNSTSRNRANINYNEHFIARMDAYNIVKNSPLHDKLINYTMIYIIRSTLAWYRIWFPISNTEKKNFYNKMKEMFIFFDKNHDIEQISLQIPYDKFKNICELSYEEFNKIKLCEKENCSGCGACASICPTNSISMREDENGFRYPHINFETCSSCALCEKTCPVLEKLEPNNKEPQCYAAMADDSIRLDKSSSGGVFSLLAEYVLDNKGYVVGAAFDNGTNLKHIIINNKEDLARLRGSKYLQSDLGDCYKRIKELLKADFQVLFTGTPCQCAGLKAYLKNEYENLICVDLICHGVPNQKIFDKYINETTSQDEDFVNMNFRDKKLGGWSPALTVTTTFSSSTTTMPASKNEYMKAFLNNLSLRRSCEGCKFRCLPMEGDITLGDFWGVDKYKPELNDQKGTSIVLLNNIKGENVFNNIKDKLKLYEQVPLDIVIKGNPHLKSSYKIKNSNKKLFLDKIKNHTLKGSVEMCLQDKCDYLINNFWWTDHNYGALLTAYALQEFVKSLGLFPKILSAKVTLKEKYKKNILDFVEKYLDITSKSYNVKDAANLTKNVKGVLLGSDQVLRLAYINRFKNLYLLNFVDDSCKKIALSASFGLNIEDFNNDKFSTKENIKLMQHALPSFDYISTREPSGVEICKNVFGVNADFVLDPVFLINKSIYENMMNNSRLNLKGRIVSYVLDKSKEYEDVYKYLEDKNGNFVYQLNINKNSVEDWLKAINDCKLFVTDSFHGVCFAIMFNKPFVCLRNKKRGDARFEALIKIFDIEKNFISQINEIYNFDLEQNYDYKRINTILENEKNRSVEILKKVLKEGYSNNPNAEKNKKINNEYLIKIQKESRKNYYLKYLNLQKCILLANLTFGKKRKHYIDKKKRLRKELELMNDRS